MASATAPIPEDLISLKTVILGESGVGKTSLARLFQKSESCVDHNSRATIGVEYFEKQMSYKHKYIDFDGEEKEKDLNVCFQIWDTAGQEKYSSLVPSYYRGAKIAILVFSVDIKNSIERLRYWANEIFYSFGRDHAKMPIIIVLCNKIDLFGTVINQFTLDELTAIEQEMRSVHYLYYETTAIDRDASLDYIFYAGASLIDFSQQLKRENLKLLNERPSEGPGCGC